MAGLTVGRGISPLSVFIMIELISITKTEIDWVNYLKISRDILDKRPKIDDKNIPPRGLFAFLENSGEPKHIYYGFFLLGSKTFFFHFLTNQDLIRISVEQSIQPDYFLGMISGSLVQFKELILWCSEYDMVDIRRLGNKLQSFFEGENIYLFKNYYKNGMNDGTYKLIEHK